MQKVSSVHTFRGRYSLPQSVLAARLTEERRDESDRQSDSSTAGHIQDAVDRLSIERAISTTYELLQSHHYTVDASAFTDIVFFVADQMTGPEPLTRSALVELIEQQLREASEATRARSGVNEILSRIVDRLEPHGLGSGQS